VYELQSEAVVPIKSFATTATAMAIRGDTLYRAVETKARAPVCVRVCAHPLPHASTS
jgi:hypothetical protein